MKNKNLVIVMLLFVLSIAGCSTKTEENSHSHEDIQANGDLHETTASTSELPQFLLNKPEEMITIYEAAATHHEVLEYIPCYCGCADSAGHKSSYNCFVHERNDDGSIVWDDHGTRCGVCLEIAATSVLEYSKGTSISEIRELIDDTYKEGYAKPTPTPKPSL